MGVFFGCDLQGPRNFTQANGRASKLFVKNSRARSYSGQPIYMAIKTALFAIMEPFIDATITAFVCGEMAKGFIRLLFSFQMLLRPLSRPSCRKATKARFELKKASVPS